MTPFISDPKKTRIRLSPAGRAALKKRLYHGRADRHCETCGRWVGLSDMGGNFNPLWHAHLSHLKHGSQKEDTEEGCKIECPQCHDRKHRGL